MPSNTNAGPQQDPGDTSLILVELPNRGGKFAGDTIAIGGNGDNSNWGGYFLYVSDDGISYSPYQQVSTPARIGTLTSDLPGAWGSPPVNGGQGSIDDSDLPTVNMTQSNSVLYPVSTSTWQNFGTLSALISPGSNVSPKETAQSGENIGTTSNALYATQGPLTVTYAEDIQESVGPLNAGTSADGTGVSGNQPWTNFSYIDGIFPNYVKSGTIPASGTAYKTTLPLKATEFGFTLPAAFVPGGIEVTFDQGYTTAGIPVISIGPVSVTTYSNNSQTRGWPGGLYTASSPAQGTAPARNSFPYTTTGVNSLVFNQVVPNYPINGFNNQPTNVGPGGGYKLNPMVAVNQTTAGNYSSSVTLNGTQTNEQSGNFDGFVLDCHATLTVTTAGTYTFYVDYANVSSFAVYIGGGATFSSTSYQGGNGGNSFPSTSPVHGYPLAIVSTNMSATAHPLMVSSYITFPSAGTYDIEVVYNQYLSTQFEYDNNGYFQITWLAGEQNQSVPSQGPGYGTQFLPTPSNTTDGTWTVTLLKAGTAVGTPKTLPAYFNDDLAVSPASLGSATDLWGVSGGFSNTDVNASNFGVQFQFTDSSGTTDDTIALCAVKLEVFGYTPTWSDPTAIEGDSAYATTTVSTTASGNQPAQYSQALLGNFTGGGAFALPASGIGPITGVEVLFNAEPGSGSPNLIAQLMIGGNPAGATRTASVTAYGSYSLGSDTDLWRFLRGSQLHR